MTEKTPDNPEDPIVTPARGNHHEDLMSGEPEGWTRYDDPPLPEDFWKMVDEGMVSEGEENQTGPAAPVTPSDGH